MDGDQSRYQPRHYRPERSNKSIREGMEMSQHLIGWHQTSIDWGPLGEILPTAYCFLKKPCLLILSTTFNYYITYNPLLILSTTFYLLYILPTIHYFLNYNLSITYIIPTTVDWNEQYLLQTFQMSQITYQWGELFGQMLQLCLIAT